MLCAGPKSPPLTVGGIVSVHERRIGPQGAFQHLSFGQYQEADKAPTLLRRDDPLQPVLVVGDQKPLPPPDERRYAIDFRHGTLDEKAHTLQKGGDSPSLHCAPGVLEPVAVDFRNGEVDASRTQTILSGGDGNLSLNNVPGVLVPAPRLAADLRNGTVDADVSHTLQAGGADRNLPAVLEPVAVLGKGGLVSDTVTSKWAKGSGGPAGSETGNLVLQRADGRPRAFTLQAATSQAMQAPIGHGQYAFETELARCLDTTGGFARGQGGTLVLGPGPTPPGDARAVPAATAEESERRPGKADGPIYAIHSDAARSGEAKTPSPDGKGGESLRNPGMGISGDGKMYTLMAQGVHGVAQPKPLGANGEVASSLQASAGHHGHSSPRGDGSDNLVLQPTYALQDTRPIEKAQGGTGVSGPNAPSYTLDTSGAQGVAHPDRPVGAGGDVASTVCASPGSPARNEGRSSPQGPGELVLHPAYGVTAKGTGEVFLAEERHTALSTGGGQPGQGYPAVMVPVAGALPASSFYQAGNGDVQETGDKTIALTTRGEGVGTNRPMLAQPRELVTAAYQDPKGDVRYSEKAIAITTQGGSPGAHNTNIILERERREPEVVDMMGGKGMALTSTDGKSPTLTRGTGYDTHAVAGTVEMVGRPAEPPAEGPQSFTWSERANKIGWMKPLYPTLVAQPPNDHSGLQQGVIGTPEQVGHPATEFQGCYDDPRRFDTRGVHGGGEHGDVHPTLESTNPKQIVAFSSKDSGQDAGEISPTLRAAGHVGSHPNAGAPPAVAGLPEAIGFNASSRDGWAPLDVAVGEGVSPTLTRTLNTAASIGYVVRRLTPLECFLPGTIVYGGEDIAIDALAEGSSAVLTRTGIDTPRATMQREYDGHIVTVKALGCLPLTATEDHPVLARAGGKTKGRHGGKVSVGKEREAPLGTLRPWKDGEGDFLLIPRLPAGEAVAAFDLSIYVRQTAQNQRGGRKTRNLPSAYPLDTNGAWLLGLYVAEGCGSLNSGQIELSLGKHETILASEAVAVAKAIGFHAATAPAKTALKVRIASAPLARLFRKLCGHKAPEKRIPDEVLLHPDTAIVRAFLRGLLAGDGYRTATSGNTLTGCNTASVRLATRLQLLLARLGTFARIDRAERGGNIDGRELKRGTLYNVTWREEIKKHPGFKVLDDAIAVPIRSVVRTPYKGLVYNFETGDHTYVVGGLLVHNCERLQGFPDHFTLIPYKGKPSPDSARFKAIGNSMAVPCMRWLGHRIDTVDRILRKMGRY